MSTPAKGGVHPIFWIVLGIIIISVVYHFIGKAMIAGYMAGEASESEPEVVPAGVSVHGDVPKRMPTKKQLLKMGYNEEEVTQIMNSVDYKAGTGNY